MTLSDRFNFHLRSQLRNSPSPFCPITVFLFLYLSVVRTILMILNLNSRRLMLVLFLSQPSCHSLQYSRIHWNLQTHTKHTQKHTERHSQKHTKTHTFCKFKYTLESANTHKHTLKNTVTNTLKNTLKNTVENTQKHRHTETDTHTHRHTHCLQN